MPLGIDIEPFIELIEAEILMFQLWTWALVFILAALIVWQLAEYRRLRSPVDRLIRKRFGSAWVWQPISSPKSAA